MYYSNLFIFFYTFNNIIVANTITHNVLIIIKQWTLHTRKITNLNVDKIYLKYTIFYNISEEILVLSELSEMLTFKSCNTSVNCM